jgi:hypothetical protein
VPWCNRRVIEEKLCAYMEGAGEAGRFPLRMMDLAAEKGITSNQDFAAEIGCSVQESPTTASSARKRAKPAVHLVQRLPMGRSTDDDGPRRSEARARQVRQLDRLAFEKKPLAVEEK